MKPKISPKSPHELKRTPQSVNGIKRLHRLEQAGGAAFAKMDFRNKQRLTNALTGTREGVMRDLSNRLYRAEFLPSGTLSPQSVHPVKMTRLRAVLGIYNSSDYQELNALPDKVLQRCCLENGVPILLDDEEDEPLPEGKPRLAAFSVPFQCGESKFYVHVLANPDHHDIVTAASLKPDGMKTLLELSVKRHLARGPVRVLFSNPASHIRSEEMLCFYEAVNEKFHAAHPEETGPFFEISELDPESDPDLDRLSQSFRSAVSLIIIKAMKSLQGREIYGGSRDFELDDLRNLQCDLTRFSLSEKSLGILKKKRREAESDVRA